MESLIALVQKIGYPGLFAIIFFESFPLTLFLPGDSLLFTTGFLASQGILRIDILILVIFIAAVLGYLFSYSLGHYIVKKFFTKDSKYFKQKYIDYTQEFFDKYGAKTIIIGRFVPIVRSFAPTLAGIAKMKYEKFVRYTFIGGVFWAGGMTLVGFYLGKAIPNATSYLTPIIVGIVFISVLPSAIEYIVKTRKAKIENTPEL
ncbi:MAG: VTT domain-containing protein [Patescibacteria group bacterium]